jgi:hypothetical protein
MEETIKEIMGKVSEDLKKIAKEHGAIIVIVVVAIYLWRKLNDRVK